MSFLAKLFGDPNARVINQLRPLVEEINEWEPKIASLTDEQLAGQTNLFRQRLAAEETLDSLLPEVFATVREAAKRTLGQRHFDVQLIGGAVLHRGQIAEMKTGEGKTLTATAAVYLNALQGRGVHVVTVNDYLARRDMIWMGKVYWSLGLSVGCINHEVAYVYDPSFTDDDVSFTNLRPVPRREAYEADITYGTNNEFGFDYLRDNMVWRQADMVQRSLHFAIVDEVDSILIDEARTPLIISAPAEEAVDRYYQIARFVDTLQENTDYNVDEKMRASTITEDGINKAERWLGVKNLYAEGGYDTVHLLEQALKAKALFKKDRDYVVRDGEVVIVDEFTGRLMPGRRYSEGLHQSIEAKENVKIQRESLTLATITFQNYFRLYSKLAGMTGTAATEAEEFHKIYNLEVVSIPTNRPMIRQNLADRVYKSEMGKYQAVVNEIKQRHEAGQPVLVGTISIERNEVLSELLKREGVPHEVLNAKHHEREAAIIAQAGRQGAVTIATNMAGRGVDIILGGSEPAAAEAELVRALGGLHVLGTERHEARRIDNQLRGRSGRQGDPGSSQFYVSLEDDLMRIFGSDRVKGMMTKLGLPEDVPIENAIVSKSIESAQKKVEGNNFDIRKHLVEYDDVLNKQRETIYKRRREILYAEHEAAEKLQQEVMTMVEKEIAEIVSYHTALEDASKWEIDKVYNDVHAIFPVPVAVRKKLEDIEHEATEASADANARHKLVNYITGLAREVYSKLEQHIINHAKELNLPNAENIMRDAEKSLLLRSIDRLWIQHLTSMDNLRGSIGLQGYAQRDPLVEYKSEAFRMFKQLLASIQDEVVFNIYKVEFIQNLAQAQAAPRLAMQEKGPAKTMVEKGSVFAGALSQAEAAVSKPRDSEGHKVGRNDPCPCGATKSDGTPIKYKHCHGK
ncbi:MAG: preprotein translocase subunit SecA [Candidatus Kerfeldbacteria bacterium]|nr:preprotein translocase subunit SecA [Candidatus Kerfeldbacteria bacterium]